MEVERRQPTDGLISALMAAEVEGQQLTDDEVIANTIITLIGGHETTTNLIASGFLTLLKHPEALEAGDRVRSTASVAYTKGGWSSTLGWGRNHDTATGRNTDGYLAETVVPLSRRDSLTGRIEVADKDE